MKRQPEIVAQSARFVYKLFREELPEWATFHNLAHTSEVVASSWEIGSASGLTAHETEIVLLAAWFHDTGYTAIARGHEEVSVEIASRFLREKRYPGSGIARIGRCIRATRVPQRPQTFLERVLCDADLNSLGRRSYFRQNDLLKLEIQKREGATLDEVMWLRRSYRFLRKHRFHTRYARQTLEKGRLNNLAALKNMLVARQSS